MMMRLADLMLLLRVRNSGTQPLDVPAAEELLLRLIPRVAPRNFEGHQDGVDELVAADIVPLQLLAVETRNRP